METINCTVEKIIFRNRENGYTVLSASDGKTKTVVVGLLADVNEGAELSVEGDWTNNGKYGVQFEAKKWTTGAPKTLYGITQYIANFTKGIGPAYAEKIVRQFGLMTLDIMNNNPERLKEVPGIGRKRLEQIKLSWKTQKEIQDVMVFLQGHGIAPALAEKIYRKYEAESIPVITENPYRLADEIRGIGFTTADTIGKSIGIVPDSYQRLRSGVLYTMEQICNQGHVFATRKLLVRRAAAILKVEDSKLKTAIDSMLHDGDLVKEDDDSIYLKPFLYAEMGISNHLTRLMNGNTPIKVDIPALEKNMGMAYDPSQVDAINYAMSHKVMVLTGGPGTGKTTVTRGIISALMQQGKEVVLAAPTGRAAKRMKEATGEEAATIHRLLEYGSDGSCGRNSENPIEGDALIVDESSMIDTILMNSLLRAMPDHMRLVLVGDVDQLPSIGAGTVLQDIINSNVIPVVRLTKIFRQAAKSKIITNCHAVRQGDMPALRIEKDSDFFFIADDNANHIAAQIVDLVVRRLPKAYKVEPKDIQVLTPQKNSTIGTSALNKALQTAVNPSAVCVVSNDTEFRVGDKVMQISNDYDKKVFNGDVGYVKCFDSETGKLIITFDGQDVEYEINELRNVSLAYATTIHKSQGSEYPIVIIPIHNTNHIMLERHLVYTGFSRARQLLVVLGSPAALRYAVRQESATKRNTKLLQRLSDSAAPLSL